MQKKILLQNCWNFKNEISKPWIEIFDFFQELLIYSNGLSSIVLARDRFLDGKALVLGDYSQIQQFLDILKRLEALFGKGMGHWPEKIVIGWRNFGGWARRKFLTEVGKFS